VCNSSKESNKGEVYAPNVSEAKHNNLTKVKESVFKELKGFRVLSWKSPYLNYLTKRKEEGGGKRVPRRELTIELRKLEKSRIWGITLAFSSGASDEKQSF